MSENNDILKENEDLQQEAPKKRKKKEKVKKSVGREILEWILTIVVALLITAVIKSFIFELVRVEGSSMMNTLYGEKIQGDEDSRSEIMLVTKYDYSSTWLCLPFNLQSDNAEQQASRFSIGTPKLLDVVICRYPARGDVNFVKRIVGMPGDTIALENGYLTINGELVEAESQIKGISKENRSGYSSSFGPFYVPKKGDKLVITNRFGFEINGEAWTRDQTTLVAKTGDGKTLKVYNRKLNDKSKTGQAEANEAVVSYDGKTLTPEEWLAAYPDLVGQELTLDEDYYFVMGDNRNHSNDSRRVGALERTAIIGHVRLVIYPFKYWRGIQ